MEWEETKMKREGKMIDKATKSARLDWTPLMIDYQGEGVSIDLVEAEIFIPMVNDESQNCMSEPMKDLQLRKKKEKQKNTTNQ